MSCGREPGVPDHWAMPKAPPTVIGASLGNFPRYVRHPARVLSENAMRKRIT